MTVDNRRRNIASELLHCHEALAAARALAGLGLANDAVSRAYYAAFHAASALLLMLELEPRTHAGVARLLTLHLEDRIGREAVSDFARLQTFRNAADYDRETRFERAEGERELARAEGFVSVAVEVLRAEGYGP